MKSIHIFIIITLIFITLGCVEQTSATTDNERFTKLAFQEVNHGEYLTVYHDNINNVTIYTWAATGGCGYSGMSAIADWQLMVPQK